MSFRFFFLLALTTLILFGVVSLNNRIEAKCISAGGQVLQSPDNFSMCLMPAGR
jgi:hypothetical protein